MNLTEFINQYGTIPIIKKSLKNLENLDFKKILLNFSK